MVLAVHALLAANPAKLDPKKDVPADNVRDFPNEGHGETDQHPMSIGSAESSAHLRPFFRAIKKIDENRNRKDRLNGTDKSLLHRCADVLKMGS